MTCRDWFQLSLKEGLTVFRDQQFSADTGSAAVRRIAAVRGLRGHQFPEDAGPMAHPVRPQSYMEINNFYTATVYEKGAEVVRMIHTLLGPENFRKGMDLYFERHDGQAVTTDDFVAAMEDASDIDLTDFRIWYEQAGTPVLSVSDSFDEASGSYQLNVTQSCPATPGQPDKEPFHIPLALGLLDPHTGQDLPLQLKGEEPPTSGAATTRVLDLREETQTFRFENLSDAPIPSLLRGFSAPVKLEQDISDENLVFVLAHDSDPFNRWDAGQKYATRVILRGVDDLAAGRAPEPDSAFVNALGTVLSDSDKDPQLAAEILTLPGEAVLGEQMEVIDVFGIHKARRLVRQWIASDLEAQLVATYNKFVVTGPYRPDGPSIAHRRLRNTCLGYLMELDAQEHIDRCVEQFRSGTNMTDTMAALQTLANSDCPERLQVLEEFETKWIDEPLVMDKWFSVQATSRLPRTLDRVKELMAHRGFDIKNPNRVRAVLGGFFFGNPTGFHAPDGAGYQFFGDQILSLDPINPQVAARMMGEIIRWRRYGETHQVLMKKQLERIAGANSLSRDVFELATKSLE